MSLVLETGTGIPNADAYVSIAETEAYFTAYGRTPEGWDDLTDAQQEAHVRIATQYLDSEYRGRWAGRKATTTQALAWPRYGVHDEDENLIANNILPKELKQAVFEAIIRSAEGDTLLGDLDAQGDVRRTSVQVGPIKEDIEYTVGSDQTARFAIIDRLLAGLLANGDNAGGSGLTMVPLIRS